MERSYNRWDNYPSILSEIYRLGTCEPVDHRTDVQLIQNDESDAKNFLALATPCCSGRPPI